MNAVVHRLSPTAAYPRPVPAPAPVEAVLADEVMVARSLDDLMQVSVVRALVYMSEQDCPFAEEFDGNDFAGATHLILRRGGEPVGTLRLRWFSGFAKLERVAVIARHRGTGVDEALVLEAFRIAAAKGYRRMIGHAQARLVPYWSRRFGARLLAGGHSFTFSDHTYEPIEFVLEPPTDALAPDSDPLVLVRPEGAWDRPGVLDRSSLRPATNPHRKGRR